MATDPTPPSTVAATRDAVDLARESPFAHVVVALQAIPCGQANDQRDRALAVLSRALVDTNDLESEIEPVAPSTLVVIAPERHAVGLLTRIASIVERLGHDGLGITGSATIGQVRRLPLTNDTLLTGAGAEQVLSSLPDAPDHRILLAEPAVRHLRGDASGRRVLRERVMVATGRTRDDARSAPGPRANGPTRWVSGRVDGWDRRDEHGTLTAEGRRHHFGPALLHPGTPAPATGGACLADVVGGRLQAVLLIGQHAEVLVTNVKPGRFAFGDVLIGTVPRNLYLAVHPTATLAVGDTVEVTIGRNPQGPVGLPV
jgi:hypothetical protein